MSKDPTRTTILRNKYSADMWKRFRRLQSLARVSIVDNDALGLTGSLTGMEADPLGRGELARLTDDQKARSFAAWIYTVADEEILEVQGRDGITVVQHNEWQRPYVSAAYARGVQQAVAQLKGINWDGLTTEDWERLIRQRFHQDKINVLLARNFTELEGIVDATAQVIQRELMDGLSQGVSPLEIARGINRKIDSVGIARARTLSRTEIIRAHSEASLNLYEQMKLDEIVAEVELTTAGDDRVCQLCADLEGKVMTVDEARGVIPVHPNCRCAWIPVNPKQQERRKAA